MPHKPEKPKFKIGLLIDSLGGGGSERQIILSAASLALQNQDVKILTYGESNAYRSMQNDLDVEIIQLGSAGQSKLGRVRALAKELKNGGYDVLHSFKGNANLYGLLAARQAGTPTMFCGYRGLDSPSAIARVLYRFLMSASRGWIVNSMAVRNRVVEMLGVDGASVHVVPNGAIVGEAPAAEKDMSLYKTFGLPDDKILVSIVAQLRPEKNHRIFLSAAKEVVLQRPDVHFAVAGDGYLRASLEKFAAESNLNENVSFLGRVQDVSKLLSITDIFVLTSNSEGLPNALIEAGIHAIASVTTDCGGSPDVVQHAASGFVAPVQDYKNIAEHLITLVDDPQMRSEMGKKARSYIAEHFAFEDLGDRLLSVYSKERFQGSE